VHRSAVRHDLSLGSHNPPHSLKQTSEHSLMQISWRSKKILTALSIRRCNIHTNRMGRSYADAVAALNTLQSNFAVIDAIRKSGRGMNQQAIPEMIEWCRKIGYEVCAFTVDLLETSH